MSVLIVLLIASISVAAIFLGAFIWTVKTGQYHDEKSPPIRILFDEEPTAEHNAQQCSLAQGLTTTKTQ